MRRLMTSSLFGLLLLFALNGAAAAKGDAMAALDTPIPPDADPGTELEVGWRAWTPGADGEWPFAGSPVFIRLTSADGASSTEVLGRENPSGSGHYLATIAVPSGGVGLVEIGLFGESCVNGVCSRSDILFELPEGQRTPLAADVSVAEPPIPAAPQPVAVPAEDVSLDSVQLALVIVAGAALASLAIGLIGRSRATTGPARVAAPAHAGLRRDP